MKFQQIFWFFVWNSYCVCCLESSKYLITNQESETTKFDTIEEQCYIRAKSIIRRKYMNTLLIRITNRQLQNDIFEAMVNEKYEHLLMKHDLEHNLEHKLAGRDNTLGKYEIQFQIFQNSIKRLQVRCLRESVMRHSFPGWLLQSNLDDYEKWMMALYVIPGENLDFMRSQVQSGKLSDNGESLPLEKVAYGLVELTNYSISKSEAHCQVNLLTKPLPKTVSEMDEVCTSVSKSDADLRIACKLLLLTNLNAERTECRVGVGSIDKFVLYGDIKKIENFLTAMKCLTENFNKTDIAYKDQVDSCILYAYKVVSRYNPVPQKRSDFIVFNATCSQAVNKKMFKDHVKKIMSKDADTRNAKITLHMDPENPEIPKTTSN